MKQFDKDNIEDEWLELVNEFPEIFLEPSPDVLSLFNEAKEKDWKNMPDKIDDLVNLRYGFEHGFGWNQIIRDFCKDIIHLIHDATNHGHKIYYKTFILKEKFGRCCTQGDFYGPDSDKYYDRCNNIIGQLEEKSLNTCEVTGKVGKRVTKKGSGWMKTLSKEIAEHEGYNYEN
jgi:hypothetical protein